MKRRIGLWFCRVMDWHKTPIVQGFDGASFCGVCPRCGRRVLRDSQGNWFGVGPKSQVKP